MGLSIDHVVISVHDVNAAIETYRELGFNAFYGGQHASGLTHNGLVVFDDGSYLELIGFVSPDSSEGEFYDLLRTDGSEGYTGFALIADDLEAEVARIRAAQIETSDIKPGSRTRTDGTVLKWKMVSLEEGRNPFVITDETPRNLRVPAEGDTIKHRNGALGIAEIRILAEDIETAMQRYQAITGSPATMQEGRALFPLASGVISLAEPSTDAERAYVAQRGSVPYQLDLIGTGKTLSPEQAHGAGFEFIG